MKAVVILQRGKTWPVTHLWNYIMLYATLTLAVIRKDKYVQIKKLIIHSISCLCYEGRHLQSKYWIVFPLCTDKVISIQLQRNCVDKLLCNQLHILVCAKPSLQSLLREFSRLPDSIDESIASSSSQDDDCATSLSFARWDSFRFFITFLATLFLGPTVSDKSDNLVSSYFYWCVGHILYAQTH